MIPEPSWTLGIEEEYFVVHAGDGSLVQEPISELMKEAGDKLGADLVKGEYLKAQIEVNTTVCSNIAEARKQIGDLRAELGFLASKYDLAIMAASTHPITFWSGLARSDDARYAFVHQELQIIVERALVCGMHVHVGIEDPDMRIDLMNQITYFLPYMLALSTSSPFWNSRSTGLLSYRTSVLTNLPRTGYPDHFDSYNQFTRYVEVLTDCEAIPDASMLWWHIRPHIKYPTLELRVCDICTDQNDTMALAALYLCLLRMLYRLRRDNKSWRKYPPGLLNENHWRAQRHGLNKGLIDFGASKVLPSADALHQIQGLLAEDAEALGCTDELAHLDTILERGTSAHRQLARHQECIDAGMDEEGALHEVCLDLMRGTMRR